MKRAFLALLLVSCVHGPGYAPVRTRLTISTYNMPDETYKAVEGWNSVCRGLFIVQPDGNTTAYSMGASMGSSGRVSYQSGRDLIVSTDLPPEARVQALAHEMGHLLLGVSHETRPGVPSVRRANMVPDSLDPTPMALLPTLEDGDSLRKAGYPCP